MSEQDEFSSTAEDTEGHFKFDTEDSEVAEDTVGHSARLDTEDLEGGDDAEGFRRA